MEINAQKCDEKFGHMSDEEVDAIVESLEYRLNNDRMLSLRRPKATEHNRLRVEAIVAQRIRQQAREEVKLGVE